MAGKTQAGKTDLQDITHDEAKRVNIPTSQQKPFVDDRQKAPVRVAYEKRNPDLDPQLVWRGKYDCDDTLAVKAPPLYIQEKVHPKALIEELRGASREGSQDEVQLNLFSDFNGMPADVDKTDFYQHEQNWTNRMILGDSLQVMASLSEREGLRGKVQAIYLDPPYGIKFNSNFQWSTNSRDVKDGKIENITREPEQVKAFRDTWEDGIHSYLSYLRDRFIVAKDLLAESGSIFVQIGDENVHHVRELLDEVFGSKNFISQIIVSKTGSIASNFIGNVADSILWYGKNKELTKHNSLYYQREERAADDFSPDPIMSDGNSSKTLVDVLFQNKVYVNTSNNHWKTHLEGMTRLIKADRVVALKNSIRYKRYYQDFPVKPYTNIWNDTGGATNMTYVVQTSTSLIQRCLLMASDPGDLVLDPTCGSGTTAYVAEQWGRRWITIDTSRVALALARARLMGARYPYYLMVDSQAGAGKEAQICKKDSSSGPFGNNIRLGFVYDRVPHVTLQIIANNPEIDDIWEKWRESIENALKELNERLGQSWEEWEVPREAGNPWPERAQKIFSALKENDPARLPPNKSMALLAELNKLLKTDYKISTLPPKALDPWPDEAFRAHREFWRCRIARQEEIDASIAARAEFELLYDKPFEDRGKVRVAGPFTVESISPYRVLGVDADDQIIDPGQQEEGDDGRDFTAMVLDNLKTAGVQQSQKSNRITFDSIEPFPAGNLICAEGRYQEGDEEKRAAIFIGPEFGTLTREDIIEAAREAGDEKFDILVACAFNFDASAGDLANRGKMPILKARMNADLHMPKDQLKKTAKGNLFVVFGEPDIDILPEGDDRIKVRINGVDVYNPSKGEIVSDNAEDIACWFVDTNYNEESFFVRQAYFLGQKDPYDSLRRALNADIDKGTWESLRSVESRPFPKPKTGRIAVKVINHLGDEVMKVFKI